LRKVTALVSLLFVLPLSVWGQVPSPAVWYVANTGILIEAGESRVLIDGLFQAHPEWEGFTFVHLDEASEQQARQDGGLLTDIDLVLSTHVHRDHFHPEEVAAYLRAHEQSVFVGNSQRVESILESDVNSPQLAERLVLPEETSGSASTYSSEDVKITFVRIPHAGAPFAWIDNDAILVEIGGRKILHVGDANPDPELFQYFTDNPMEIDLVIAPYWFLLQAPGQDQVGHHIITEILRTKDVVAVHLPPDPERTARYGQMLRETYPNIVIPAEPLQKVN